MTYVVKNDFMRAVEQLIQNYSDDLIIICSQELLHKDNFMTPPSDVLIRGITQGNYVS